MLFRSNDLTLPSVDGTVFGFAMFVVSGFPEPDGLLESAGGLDLVVGLVAPGRIFPTFAITYLDLLCLGIQM